MPQHDLSLVDGIRSASRLMVRELGFMQATLAATDYPPSAVHALLEIGAQQRMAASQLAQALGLEKSSVSRMVRKLVEAGELKEAADGEDGRVKQLALTAKGRRTLAAIEAFGRRQVTAALDRMQPPQQQAVSRGLALYAQALQAHRQQEPLPAASQMQILHGYRPGCIGRIVEMHARFYARHAGFGAFFESRVASGLAEFAGRLDKPCNQLWTALDGERIVLARFMPFIRTFAPFVAGVAAMTRGQFTAFQVGGARVGVFGISAAGSVGGNLPGVRETREKIIWGLILVPGLIAIFGAWRAGRAPKTAA
jgi:DNA-binding MarR family transcriptional regulator